MGGPVNRPFNRAPHNIVEGVVVRATRGARPPSPRIRAGCWLARSGSQRHCEQGRRLAVRHGLHNISHHVDVHLSVDSEALL